MRRASRTLYILTALALHPIPALYAQTETESPQSSSEVSSRKSEQPGHYSLAVLAGPTRVYSKKYRTYVETLLNKDPGTYLSTHFRFQYQPDGITRHLAVDVELQGVNATEKDSYDGGDVSVSYQSSALVGGLRYFACPDTAGWDRFAISFGINGGFAGSRIKVSSPTGEFEFTDSEDLVAGGVGGILYRVAGGLYVAGDIYVGARASLIGGVGYAF